MLRNSSNERAVDYANLAGLLLARAKRYDTKVLYRFWRAGRWQSLTWNDALIRVKELALGLVSLGVSGGDRVAVFSGNCVEWLLVDWANICIAGSVRVMPSDTSSRSNPCSVPRSPVGDLYRQTKRLEREFREIHRA